MRGLSVFILLVASGTVAQAYDFHSSKDTAAQIRANDDAFRKLYPSDPMKAQQIIDELALRRQETIRETAFRHMVDFCENLDREEAVARCDSAVNYYKIIREEK